MGIDLLIALLVLASFYLGYQRGLILAIFSFLSIWVGIFLAFTFTSVVGDWLGQRMTVSGRWLPILSFLLILVGVIILVRLGAKALERVLEVAQLGTFNRVAGALLYSVVLLSVCAATFQGLQWAGVVTAAERQSSFFLQHVEPFFMEAFRGVSRWIPGKGDVFESLERYFQSQRSAAPVL
ncbi:MAG: hypothetical protein FJX92_00945 [Bacteroidetes bacterium]|nr:hypothetical protein [Bacteroidota bacterium]